MLFTEQTQNLGEFSSTDQGTTMRLWDSVRGQSIWTIEPREHASSPAPSADGKRFIVVRKGSYPELRDVNSREVILRFGHSITDFVIAPDGNSVLTASAAGKVRIWESKDGRERSRLPGRDGYISAMAISPDAQILAAAFEDEIQLWDASGKSHGLITTTADVRSLEFSPNGSVLAGRNYSEGFQLWNPSNGTPILLPEVGPGSRIDYANSSSVVLREEERKRALDSGQGPNFERRLSLINLDNRKPVWEGAWRPSGSQHWVFSPDGSLFARDLGNEAGVAVDVITTTSGDLKSRFKIGLEGGMADFDGLTLLGISPNNRVLLVGQAGGDGCGGSFSGVRAFDLENGTDLKLPKKLANGYETFVGCGTGGEFPKFKFSPDGKYLAVKHDNSIDLWGARDRSVVFGNP
jgi:WD40 repeat protein